MILNVIYNCNQHIYLVIVDVLTKNFFRMLIDQLVWLKILVLIYINYEYFDIYDIIQYHRS